MTTSTTDTNDEHNEDNKDNNNDKENGNDKEKYATTNEIINQKIKGADRKGWRIKGKQIQIYIYLHVYVCLFWASSTITT